MRKVGISRLEPTLETRGDVCRRPTYSPRALYSRPKVIPIHRKTSSYHYLFGNLIERARFSLTQDSTDISTCS